MALSQNMWSSRLRRDHIAHHRAYVKKKHTTSLGMIGWLVGFGFNGPLRQYFSLYRAVSQREGERRKKG